MPITEIRFGKCSYNIFSVLNDTDQNVINAINTNVGKQSLILKSIYDSLQNAIVFSIIDKKDYDAMVNYLKNPNNHNAIGHLRSRMKNREKRYLIKEEYWGKALSAPNMSKYATYKIDPDLSDVMDEFEAKILAFELAVRSGA